ncbi:MAG TPA: TIM barrel protein [Bryobacteraceae bacterium]|nr:TIM barrel protein [Bryobacteraceae bacterium]
MNRRMFIGAAGSIGVAAAQQASNAPAAARRGRIKQAVSKWCFDKWWTLDQLCQNCVKLGIKGVDLVGPADWPTLQKYNLACSMMMPGGGTIPDGLNRTENHEKIEQQLRDGITKAAAAGVPNIITFSGNRRGLADAEGLENCVTGLNRIKAFAEEKGVTVCLELLNSKVNHKDYQADKTAWGAEVCKRVGSPRVKLLYDIYHMQIMEGDIIRIMRENIQHIGHIHTGGNPGRNEIDSTQELNYGAIARAIADLNFTGFVAHEFVPKRDPFQSLQEAVEICDV